MATDIKKAAAAPAMRLDLGQYVEQSYLNYAMYVVLDRALPHVADGLKPVQRRILFAMHELALRAQAKPKKAARTIGDVIGKYHPHGDAAAYEAMVHIAQPFTVRYPLVDGQGNWGSPEDPTSYAAMRYTEAKLTSYADTLLSEIGMGTVDWQDNFDATLREPTVLPALLPNLLINGARGIAVGMSTSIPPHNIKEVVAACVYLLRNPNCRTQDLTAHLPAPDFPSPTQLMANPQELLHLYETGKGAVRMRGVWEKMGKNLVIVRAIPPQLSVNQIIEQIGNVIIAKKIPDLVGVRDEGDAAEPVRIALELRSSRVSAADVMHALCQHTDFEKTLRFNFNLIGLHGKPQVMGLKQVLSQWLEFRRTTLTRRLQFRLEQVMRRLHILAAYLAAFDQLDEVIAIIRHSDSPQEDLEALLGLDAEQVRALLEIRLRQLAKMEQQALQKEQTKLQREADTLRKQLGSQATMTRLLIKGLQAAAQQWGDARRTHIITDQPATRVRKGAKRTGAASPIVVVLSQAGWIRALKTQEPSPEVLARLGYRRGDRYACHTAGDLSDQLLICSDTGKSFGMDPAKVPVTNRGNGEPLTRHLELHGSAAISMHLVRDGDLLLTTTAQGYGCLSRAEAVVTRQSTGKQLQKLRDGDLLLPPCLAPRPVPEHLDELWLALGTSDGFVLVLPAETVPVYAPGSRGVRLIGCTPGAVVVATALFQIGDALAVDTGRAAPMKIRPQDMVDHYVHKRGQQGHKLPRGYTKIRGLSSQPSSPPLL